jgi:hypothetical protein
MQVIKNMSQGQMTSMLPIPEEQGEGLGGRPRLGVIYRRT